MIFTVTRQAGGSLSSTSMRQRKGKPLKTATGKLAARYSHSSFCGGFFDKKSNGGHRDCAHDRTRAHPRLYRFVGSGLAASLAKPGGNVTGISILATEVDANSCIRQHALLDFLSFW
jgi:hypothetical protein